MSHPQLSIIIPTRNRQFFCKAAVDQIISLKLPDTEIVVQDNSDNDELKNSIGTADYAAKGVKYAYTPEVISFVENFNRAIDLSSGEYLCMIGDDDGILPSIVKAVNFCKKNDYDALIPILSNYIWPGNDDYSQKQNGELTIYARKRFQPFDVDTNIALDKLIANSFQGYNAMNIPRIYHGLVRRSCVEAVKDITGSYFYGLSPDIYLAVALCFTCKRVVVVDYPVTVSGVCKKSGTSDHKSGRHTGDLKDAPHFRGHKDYKWDEAIPYVYSVESIWAETAMKALRTFSTDKPSAFSRRNLVVLIMANYPSLWKQSLDSLQQAGESTKGIRFAALKLRYKRRLRRNLVWVAKKILRRRPDIVHTGVKDIVAAAEITHNEFKDATD